ncbi:hypothetical protein SGLAM104S_06729 [Streptomyces glaucescens]
MPTWPRLGRVLHEELRLVDLLLQAAVHPVQVYLFDADLPIADGVVTGVLNRFDRGSLLSLCGHRAPF